jgi:hypothetical protein
MMTQSLSGLGAPPALDFESDQSRKKRRWIELADDGLNIGKTRLTDVL